MGKLTQDHVATICETNGYLAEIFDAIGIAEFSKSSKKKEIFFDVQDSGKVDPVKLQKFAEVIEDLYHTIKI